MKTLNLRNSIDRSPLGLGLPRVQSIWIIRGFLLITLLFACFALSPTARAVSPAPDGGYPNNNTAEGASALFSLTSFGHDNTAIGFSALFKNTSGYGNTANGASALLLNTGGHDNTANGAYALQNNIAGFSNTATGMKALFSNTTINGLSGRYNTATGDSALYSNTTGNSNTANGALALYSNTTGFLNTATGDNALVSNTTGNYNTANGNSALHYNITGNYNTANGYRALFSNTTISGVSGANNTATGFQALYSNTTGVSNTANGVNALYHNTTGSRNTATGLEALVSNTNGANNTANGVNALRNTTGGSNIGLGYNAGINLTTGSNNIDIGNLGLAAESSTTRIGNAAQVRTFIAGIRGVTTGGANAVPVVIDSAGQLGTASSSRRFKKEIKPMDQTSEALLGLKPVTFQYKSDNTGTPQFGLIAEEVAKVNPDLVVHDEKGEIYTVRYDAVNAMLLNEFLKEHRKVEEQQATISQLKRGMETVVARLKEQDSEIQKVSAQLEASKPAPQVVTNDQ
jgi:trimeric autotransporter adhesin